MKKIRLNTMHRYVGIVTAPFLVLQTVSGLLLDFGLFRREGGGPGGGGYQESWGVWDKFLVKAHFGPSLIGDAYHLLLGVGIIWMAASGWLLYLRLRRIRKNAANQAAKP